MLTAVNPSGAETRIFQGNYVNIMAADALTPSFARSSTTMIFTEAGQTGPGFFLCFFQSLEFDKYYVNYFSDNHR